MHFHHFSRLKFYESIVINTVLIGSERIVRLLIDGKADLNALDKSGKSPLDLATENGTL